ncbi:hypothetical protein BGZ80_006063, partial [Entomortierella chlamydospora]
MEYVNQTTLLAVAGLFAVGIFYISKNFVEPKSLQQRAILAEQAQKELLEEHESQAKRGSNKQAKK